MVSWLEKDLTEGKSKSIIKIKNKEFIVSCPYRTEIEKKVDTKDKKFQVFAMKYPYCTRYRSVIDRAKWMCENCSNGKFKS